MRDRAAIIQSHLHVPSQCNLLQIWPTSFRYTCMSPHRAIDERQARQQSNALACPLTVQSSEIWPTSFRYTCTFPHRAIYWRYGQHPFKHTWLSPHSAFFTEKWPTSFRYTFMSPDRAIDENQCCDHLGRPARPLKEENILHTEVKGRRAPKLSIENNNNKAQTRS
jgi:hypothetical protein